MRKIKVAIILISVLLACSVGTLQAYFTDSDSKNNKISPQKNEIKVVEEFNPPDSLVENSTFVKKPTVKCTEGVDCYVRIYCEFNDSNVAKFASMDWNTTDWTEKQPDGYYYYKKKISKGEETKPLFTKVSIADGTASLLKDFDIIVYAESVQAFNTSTKTFYSDYISAWKYWNADKEGLE